MSARASLRAHAHQHREARAAHARRALEVEDAERGAELPVRPGIEVERRRLAVPAHDLIVLGRPADRHARVRQVRQRQQQRRALLLDLIELDLELPDVLRARLAGGKERRRVQALPLGARDFVAGRVLLALEPSISGISRRRLRLERRQLLEIGVGVEAAIRNAARTSSRWSRTKAGSIMR